MKYFIIIIIAESLFWSCDNASKKEINIGQVWEYKTREEEQNSRAYILGSIIYNTDSSEIKMYLIKVDKLKFKKNNSDKFYFVIDEVHLLNSITSIDDKTKFAGSETNFHLDVFNQWSKLAIERREINIDADIKRWIELNDDGK